MSGLTGSREEFAGDLRFAVGAWGRAPYLPVIAALFFGPVYGGNRDPVVTYELADVTLAPVLLAIAIVVFIAFVVFVIGWSGAERLAYARLAEGDPAPFGEMLAAAWGYVGRFLVLGLLLLVPMLLLSALLSVAATVMGVELLGEGLAELALFVVLTFVTPALALDDLRPTEALGRGWRVLRSQGMAARWYAFTGPLVLVTLTVLASIRLPARADWLIAAVAGVWGSTLRGATVAAYLRLSQSEDLEADAAH